MTHLVYLFRSRGEEMAFATGYIDGDGCLHRNKENRIELSCLGTLAMMKWMRCLFFPQLNTNISKRNNIYCFKVTGQYAQDVVNQIIKLPIPFLKRKWYN